MEQGRLPSDDVVCDMIAQLIAMLDSEDMGKKDVMQAVEDKRTAETPVAADESFTNPAVESMFGETPLSKSEEDLFKEAKAEQENMFRRTNEDRHRFSTEEEKKVLSTSEVETAFKDDSTVEEDLHSLEVDEILKKLFDSDMFSSPRNKEFSERKKDEARKAEKKKPNVVAYEKDTMYFGDKSIPFKRVKMKATWGSDFEKDDTFGNLLKLRNHISNDILKQFGDWGRIRTIHVFSEQLIINGICYTPLVNKAYCDCFPLDTLDYISNGTIASLFDWAYLRKMSNLVEMHIDSMQFYVVTMCDDLGWHKDACALFKICHNLQTLSIGGDLISEDGLNVKTTANSKRKGIKMSHFRNLFDGYKLDVYKGTQGVQNFAFNNLKNYASNRGNKGIFRYVVGTTVRAGLATGAGVVNLGAHLIGGIFKTVKNTIKDAVTPVSNSDM